MKKAFLVAFVACHIACLNSWSQSSIGLLVQQSGTLNFDSFADIQLQMMIAHDSVDTSADGRITDVRRGFDFIENRICNNAPEDENKISPASQALRAYLSEKDGWCSKISTFTGNWTCIGPFSHYFHAADFAGRVDAVWADPDDVDHVLIGASSGGIWESIDGGEHWANITDASENVIPGTMGIRCITVDYLDHDVIYASAYSGPSIHSYDYGIGLVYSDDAGATWQMDNGFEAVLSMPFNVIGTNCVKVAYMPGTEELYAITSSQVLYKSSPAGSWSDITPSLGTGFRFTDLEFTSAGKVVISTNGLSNVAYFYVYSPSLTTWSSFTMSLTSPNTMDDYHFGFPVDEGIHDFSISSTGNIYAVVYGHNAGTYLNQLWESSISSPSWTMVSATTPIEKVYVSPANEDIIYATRQDGGTCLWRSTNAGSTFSALSGEHADSRSVLIYSTTNTSTGIDDVVFVTSDGGVGKKPSGSSTVQSITGEGLCILQSYSLSNYLEDDDYIVTGAQDNYTWSFIKDRTDQWDRDLGGDGYMSAFARGGIATAYTENNFPGLSRTSFTGTTSSNIGNNNPNDANSGLGPFDPWNNHQRPYFIDDDNEVNVGYFQTWSQTAAFGTWSSSYAAQPKSGIGITAPDKLSLDIVECRTNPDIAYLAYKRAAFTDPSTSVNTGRLFVSTNATGLSPTWTNITPPQVESFRINDIEIDQDNPNRIWVALGDIDWGQYTVTDFSSMQNRVFYSDDYGSTWIDMSAGLPDLPANKVLYIPHTEDDLYVGTDVGVFHWVQSKSIWECFSNGLVNCIVTDMEFNSCAEKLRISTWGRGIWETSLLQDELSLPQGNEDITSNTTWDAYKICTGNVTIKSGATLTITTTSGPQTEIHMPKNARILVEPGGQLIVDNAKLTNGCDDCLWRGIEAQGTYSAPQNTTNSGYVQITNGSIVEHAINGVANFKSSNGDLGDDWGDHGGVLLVDNSTFRDCHRAVNMQPFQNTNPAGYPKNDKSIFTLVTFTIDDDYKGTGDFYPFNACAFLNSVNGIYFYGCHFGNDATEVGLQYVGQGITSWNSRFSVLPYCNAPEVYPCEDITGSSFDNFYEGVLSGSGGDAFSTFDVNTAEFTGCTIGIHSLNGNHFTSVFNRFNIGDGVPVTESICFDHIGIYTQNTRYFNIEENSFIGPGINEDKTTWYGNVGVVIDKSGPEDKQTYRNSYSSLDFGTVCIGVNRSQWPPLHPVDLPIPPTGLKILCSTFENNGIDIQADLGESALMIGEQNGIHPIQQNSLVATGNDFPLTDGHIVNNTGAKTTYVDNGGTTHPVTFPGFINYEDAAPRCGTNYPDHGTLDITQIDEEDIGSISTAARAGKKAAADSFAKWRHLMDAGNSDSLVYAIRHYTAPTIPSLYNMLQGIAPFLSDTALYAAADSGLLSSSQLKRVLQNCPDLLFDTAFVDYFRGVPNPLSSGAIDSLLAADTTRSKRTKLEEFICRYSSDYHYDLGILLTAAKNDSSASLCDSIPVWLGLIGSPGALYERSTFYDFIGDSAAAISDFSHALTDFPNNGMDTLNNAKSIAFYGLLRHMRTAWHRELNPNATEETILSGIIGGGQGLPVQVTASGLDHFHPFDIHCYSISAGHKNTRNTNEPIGVFDNSRITAYPNPSTGIVNFKWNLDKDGQFKLVVANSLGQIVKTVVFTDGKGETIWDTDGLPSGNYFYRLSDTKGMLGYGEVVLIKK